MIQDTYKGFGYRIEKAGVYHLVEITLPYPYEQIKRYRASSADLPVVVTKIRSVVDDCVIQMEKLQNG